MSILSIGKTYQLYTKYETIYNQKLKVVAILTFDEAEKVPYNMNVLAINEKVISISDEVLETILEGQTIYHLRAVTANTDGSFSEYIIWDSIIDKERTSQINVEYNYNMNITLTLDTTTSMSQIIADIENHIQTNYGSTISFKIENKIIAGGLETDGTTDTIKILEDKIKSAEQVINALNKLNNTLVPASERLSKFDLSSTIDSINNELISISSSISTISAAIR
jgi:hypothetical protein